MNYLHFLDSLAEKHCPKGLNSYLQALWYDANGDWDAAHKIVQCLTDPMAARIHAYLHRKAGSDWNARYWHREAGTQFPQGMSLKDEWDMLVRENT